MSTTSLTLYDLEEQLIALLDTEEMPMDDQTHLAILDEIVQTNQAAIAKRDNCIRFLRSLDQQVEFADQEIERLKRRKSFFRNNKERIEGYLLTLVQKFGVSRGKGSLRLEGTIGALQASKNPPGVTITQDSAIPLEYCDVNLRISGVKYGLLLDRLKHAGLFEEGTLLAACATLTPRKALLKDAILSGDEVPGAELRQGLRLEVC